MAFIYNSTDTVGVEKEDIKAVMVQGLLIVFKMCAGPDIVFEQASDQAQLETLKTRTVGLLS